MSERVVPDDLQEVSACGKRTGEYGRNYGRVERILRPYHGAVDASGALCRDRGHELRVTGSPYDKKSRE